MEHEAILGAAAKGWLYSINFDFQFISDNSKRIDPFLNQVSMEDFEQSIERKDPIKNLKPIEILGYLKNTAKIENQFNRLAFLCSITNSSLCRIVF